MKKRYIIIFLLLSVLFAGCSTKEEVKHFEFTVTEFIEALNAEYSIDLDLSTVIDAEDGTKAASYTSDEENNSVENMIRYQITYDDKTEKVSFVSFFFDKNFMNDIEKAFVRYYYHISAIAETITPEIDIDKLLETISNANGIKEGTDSFAIYNGDDFNLISSCNDKFFNAVFEPIEN